MPININTPTVLVTQEDLDFLKRDFDARLNEIKNELFQKPTIKEYGNLKHLAEIFDVSESTLRRRLAEPIAKNLVRTIGDPSKGEYVKYHVEDVENILRTPKQ